MNVTGKGLRDLFFLLVGSAILYQQFWERPDPSPLGVFVALFLYGLIPAFRADETSLSPLAALMALLAAKGTKAPPDPVAEQEAKVEKAVEAARVRAAARAALADREDQEARQRRSSPPESNEPGSS